MDLCSIITIWKTKTKSIKNKEWGKNRGRCLYSKQLQSAFLPGRQTCALSGRGSLHCIRWSLGGSPLLQCLWDVASGSLQALRHLSLHHRTVGSAPPQCAGKNAPHITFQPHRPSELKTAFQSSSASLSLTLFGIMISCCALLILPDSSLPRTTVPMSCTEKGGGSWLFTIMWNAVHTDSSL